MARTYRNLLGMNRCALRNPRTSNERKSLLSILQDNRFEEYNVSGVNRIHRRLKKCPTSYDDLVISGYKENYDEKI